MAENSGFFDAHLVNGEYDRVYLAENFAKYFASFISNGIFGGKSNELMVQQKVAADMGVRVLSGKGYINGYYYENTDELPLAIEVADGVLNRIDIVVLRWYKTERVIRLAIVKGTPASSPSVPDMIRSEDYYDLKLAEIFVRAGATSIIQANITDKRLDNSVCGFVHGLIEQFDTTEFGKELDSFIENFETYNTQKMNEVLAKLNAMANQSDLASLIFDVENLKDDNSTLKTNMETLESDVTEVVSDTAVINQTLGYTKKNLLPYPYTKSPGMISFKEGVEWFDNGDGTITALGTANASNSYYTLYEGEIPKWLKPGKYLLSAGPQHTQSCYVFFVKIKKGTTTEYAGRVKSIDDVEIEITEQDIAEYNILISAFVEAGKSVSRVKLSPMIRSVEFPDDTWEPFRYSVDELYHEDETTKGCFYRFNNVTKEKEWINPPCKPGVEYCLTERWNNKPVYQTTLYAATLPISSALSIKANTTWDRVVSISGYVHDADDLTYYPFPVILHSQVNPIAVISRVEGDGGVVITTNADASHLKAYITIKYTK